MIKHEIPPIPPSRGSTRPRVPRPPHFAEVPSRRQIVPAPPARPPRAHPLLEQRRVPHGAPVVSDYFFDLFWNILEDVIIN